MIKEKKIHTGFRISKPNLELLEEYEKSLGINKTTVVDMLLTILRKDEKIMPELIKKALEDKANAN